MSRGMLLLACLPPVLGGFGADIVIETESLRLTIGEDARARSLVVTATQEECLDVREGIPLFATTQIRPFNNETKLVHSIRRTTYPADRVRREGDQLVVGFAVAPYEAVVRVKPGRRYVAFELVEFRSNTTDERQYKGLEMDVPPVEAFRLVQLPVRNRAKFGDWLNVVWDDRAAVAVVAAEPLVEIGNEERFGFRNLTADLYQSHRLEGATAAVVVGAGGEDLLEGVRELEEAFDLPRGVESRRNPLLNASIMWVPDVTPKNVDEMVRVAARGGFRLMLLYHSCFEWRGDYSLLGNYDFNSSYPNGLADVKVVFDKIKSAGIRPGFHTLQTHVGFDSRYVTPVADPRLNKKRKFTLSRAMPAEGDVDEIFVLQNPQGSPRRPACRILQFGGELFSYDGFSTDPPYRFTGVRRGAKKTTCSAHPYGEIGGVLDVSEYLALSCYIDQDTDLQDEVADKIAAICNQGAEFCYFDGSEGVPPPCGINVAYSQWRVTRKFVKQPLFIEGAAKSHFGWHLQAGANAFDPFDPEVFKEKIVEYPLAAAPLMRQNFTRVDFGWWECRMPGKGTVGTQPDMWEYGTSKAAAWDCPATVQIRHVNLGVHPREADLLETMRRWEDVRARNLLTQGQKEMLKDPNREYHLVPDGKGGYDLAEWSQLAVAGGKWTDVRAFLHEARGRRVVTYWHVRGEGTLKLPGGRAISVGAMKELHTDMSADDVRRDFMEASIETDRRCR